MRQRRLRRRAAATCIVGCLLAPAAIGLGPSGARAAPAALMSPGLTLPVSGSRPPTEDDPAAGSPSVSDDGSTAAYTSSVWFDDSRGSRVLVRDVVSEGTIDVDLPRRDLANPSLSGDGSRVAVSATQGERPSDERDGDFYVGTLGEEAVDLSALTGTETDLAYQRSRFCTPDIRPIEVLRETDRCGPQLSRDGLSVALPARLSLRAPRIRLSIEDPYPAAELRYGSGQTGTLDFGSFGSGGSDGSAVVLTLRVSGPDAVHIDGAEITSGKEFFSAPPPTDDESGRRCFDVDVQPSRAGDGDLDGDQECTITVRIDRRPECATRFGTLELTSPTPRGRTALALVGEDGLFPDGQDLCVRYPPVILRRPAPGPALDVQPGPGPRPGPVLATARAAAVADCDPVLDVPTVRAEGDEPGTPILTRDVGEVPVGRTEFVARTIEADSETRQIVDLRTNGCDVQFVPGPQAEDEGPPSEPCVDGLVLGPNLAETCTAVVAVTPGQTAPVAAALALVPCTLADTEEFECRPYGDEVRRTRPDRVIRFVGAGVQDVVVVRRDSDGDGDFAGAQDPPAIQVSIDDSGDPVDGLTPSISANGRFVAFASTGGGRWERTQVLVHDTDRGGDGTYVPGATLTASRLAPGNDGLPDEALQPSLSGSGRRVAFVTREATPNAGADVQVHLRDLDEKVTLLVSSRAGTDDAGEGWSYSPSISRDGSTVAFASLAPDLTAPATDLCCSAVFLRDVGPTLADRNPGDVEIISLRPDGGEVEGDAGLPSVNADGGVTLFESEAFLVTDGDQGRASHVYARARFSDVEVSPVTIDFPPQEIGRGGESRPITVTNSGAGASNVVDVTVSGPFVITGPCGRAVLHRGESCTVEVAFDPTEPGPATGEVDITTTDFGRISQHVFVRLRGTALTPLIRVRPRQIVLADTGLGVRSKPEAVEVTNTGLAALTVLSAVTVGDREFAVEAGDGCSRVPVGGSCLLRVTLSPQQLGERLGTIRVLGVLGELVTSREVAASGTTLEPTLEFSPTVAQEGRVTFIRGEHFMPGSELTLVWSRGLISTGRIIPDADGSFAEPAVILKGAGTGQRTVDITMQRIKGKVTSPPLLVVPGSAQPPDFLSRG